LRLRLLPTITGFSFAALAATALAITPISPTRPDPGAFGGGYIDTAYRPHPGDPNTSDSLNSPVSVRVAKDGKTARFFVNLNVTCNKVLNDQTSFFSTAAVRTKISGDGHFRYDKGYSFTFADRPAYAVLSFKGTFWQGGRATGSARLREVRKNEDGTQTRCVSKRTRWELRQVGNVAQPDGHLAPGAAYYGFAAKRTTPKDLDYGKPFGIRLPVMVRVSKDGKRVALATWYWTNKCTSDIHDFSVNFSPPARIRPDGSFSSPEQWDKTFTDVVGHNAVTFKGRFTPRGVAGVYRIHTVYNNVSDGALNDTCDTGVVRWRAVR
jgi:hypothetical protein